MLTNSGNYELLGPADLGTIGNGVNNTTTGYIDVEGGSTLNITGNVTNAGGSGGPGGLGTGILGSGGNTLTVSGSVTNSGKFGVVGVGDSATIGSLTNNAGGFVNVENGSTLTVSGNVTNNATGPQGIYTGFFGLGSGSTIKILGTLTNNGMFGLESAGDIAKVTGAVSNTTAALFAQTGGSSATFSSTLTNSGVVDLENASSLTVNGAVDNSGILSTSRFGGIGSNTMTFNALVTNNSGAHVDILGPNDTVHMPGGLANSGFVFVQNGSTIDPPFINNFGGVNIDSTSTFVVGTGTHTGTGYIQLANGTLGEMIGSSAFGQIGVMGNASLNGTLDILLQGGFNPGVGTTYDIILMSPGGLTGSFSTILNQVFNGGSEIWMVNYNNTGGYVSLTAAPNGQPPVPEPGTFLLFGSSLIGAAYTVRRRWLK
jgi:fibronectin-binding autotransporter adhesin